MTTRKDMSKTMRIDLIPFKPVMDKRRVMVVPADESVPDSLAKPGSAGAQRDSNQELLDSIYDATFLADAMGTIVNVNSRAVQFLRRPRNELIGFPMINFISGGDEKLIRTLGRNLEDQHFVILQAYCIRKDRSLFPAEIVVSQLRSSPGIMCLFIRDITIRRQAEEMLLTEHNAIQNAASGIAITNREGILEYGNPAFAAILDITKAEDLAGVGLHEILVGHEIVAEMIRTVMDHGKSWTGEVFAELPTGKTIYLQVQATPNHNSSGEKVGVVFSFSDLSERKEAEKALLETNRQLESARIKAEAASVAKSDFLANMSHELRTPLNAILGLSEALIEQVRGPLNERQLQSLRNIETSGRHLLELISDILDLSKVEAGVFCISTETVSVHDVCLASMAFVREMADKKQIQLHLMHQDQMAQIEADPRRLRQMLVNLLSNAVKFTPEGGAVILETALDTSAKVVRFSVQDTGIGISRDDFAKLFQPFTQLDASLRRRHEGTGLGLSLTRKLVELHHGAISVKSEPGKGSRFIITLPCFQPRKAPDASSGAAASQAINPVEFSTTIPPLPIPVSGQSARSAPVRILLVEDNEGNIESIVGYLEDKGYQVAIARNGQEAIDQASQSPPDIILMDIQMPVMDGFEAIRRLRADGRFSTLPIVALTALAMPSDEERCLAAGANAYVTKPVRLKELIALMERLLGKER